MPGDSATGFRQRVLALLNFTLVPLQRFSRALQFLHFCWTLTELRGCPLQHSQYGRRPLCCFSVESRLCGLCGCGLCGYGLILMVLGRSNALLSLFQSTACKHLSEVAGPAKLGMRVVLQVSNVWDFNADAEERAEQ